MRWRVLYHSLLPSSLAVWRATPAQREPVNAHESNDSRPSLIGKRAYRSRHTSEFEHARLKHAKRARDVEKDRQHPRWHGMGGEVRQICIV
jgi:hypothetical protein